MATELTTYKYEARHQATGKAVSGKTKARDEETVSNGLFEAGYIPLNIQAETRLNKNLTPTPTQGFATITLTDTNLASTGAQALDVAIISFNPDCNPDKLTEGYHCWNNP